ncbi:PFL_4695 family integrating conjugative element protein [Legionella maceachernii]|uniref:Integrating conjugative element protein, PFL_4695 family n=1 Tax=Legionella maceachernii TaxID=466 RepID=A0A0W0VUM2_9GAMM|nr:integrating conjugative element protein [Legionella maceachernii]KTD23936.1 hypothetical protein Lmac_2809 [Legionella maceachernii]SKA18558.1 integrating conjugative element protein, PFL_4695 family [Legionella maceachernii]SUP04501.1 integrating conjugative element protein, PFL_4695 family [Legionella maceachernii]
MKNQTFLCLFLIIGSCYGWQIAELRQANEMQQMQITQASLKLQEKLDARLPAKSKATSGSVASHHVNLAHFSYPLFILSADALSYQWLKTHSQELEEINAIGFITNIENSQQLNRLQELTKMPLLPANVDDLMALLHETHYPLIFNKGKVWQ